MPDPHWDNLKEIFNAAVALPPAERSAYLDRVCDGSDALRQAVENRSLGLTNIKLMYARPKLGNLKEIFHEAVLAGQQLFAAERLFRFRLRTRPTSRRNQLPTLLLSMTH
jgi:hypothetical protein